MANDHASLPIAYRLYLPEAWANDADRRAKAGVPEDVVFRTKPRSPLIRSGGACRWRADGVVLADAGYGIDTAFRNGVDGNGLDLRRRHPVLDRPVAAGERTSAAQDLERARASALAHAPPSASTSRSRRRNWRSACRRDAWRRVTGAKAPMRRSPRASPPSASGRRIAITGAPPAAEEWFLIEWPQGEKRADQILALDLAAKTRPSTDLVDQAKLRWRIERDYQELKQEIGLGHYEGRGWRGFHHHATLGDRRLRIPGLRAESDSPLRASLCAVPQSASPTQRLSTPRLRRSDPNVTSPTRSPASALDSRAPWRDGCSDVRAARGPIYDTVRLRAASGTSSSTHLGLLLSVVVLPADIQDRDGAFELLHRARRLFPFIERIFADGGYRGEKMALVISRTGAWKLEIVKRSDAAKGFEVLPKRWIVTVCTMLPS